MSELTKNGLRSEYDDFGVDSPPTQENLQNDQKKFLKNALESGAMRSEFEEDEHEAVQLKPEKKDNLNKVDYWWEIVQSRGGSELDVHAFRDQLEAAGIDPGSNYPTEDFYGDKDVDVQGIKLNNKNTRPTSALQQVSEVVKINLNSSGQESSFFFSYQQPIKDHLTLFRYSFLCHESNRRRDKRSGGHGKMSLAFALPFEDSLLFIKDLEEDPLLIEKIFMKRYSKLVEQEGGLARVKSKKLIVIKAIPDDLFSYKDLRSHVFYDRKKEINEFAQNNSNLIVVDGPFGERS